MDCIDGSLARLKGSEGPVGAWFDAQTAYTVYAVLPLALSYKLMSLGYAIILFDNSMLLSACVSEANLYSRVLFQKYLLVLREYSKTIKWQVNLQRASLQKRYWVFVWLD